MTLAFIIVVIFALTMIMAAIKDASTMTIPNWISLVLIAGFFIIIPFLGQVGKHLAPTSLLV